MSSITGTGSSSRARKISLTTKIFYGFGSVANGVKSNAFSYLIMFFYVQVAGVEGFWFGITMFLVMIVDAISDPIVGHISDNWKSKWGRRHPFMYFSAIPVSISFFLLFKPPVESGQVAVLAYFFVIAVCVRTFITMFEIPSTSLAPEFTSDYDQRTTILAFRFFFGWWGGLTIAFIAYRYLFAPTEKYSDGFQNPEAWNTYGILGSLVIFAAIIISTVGTHREIPNLIQSPVTRKFSFKHTFGDMFESLSNKNFQVVFLSAIIAAMAGGVNSALVLYFNRYFWELSSLDISNLQIPYYFSAAFALFFAPYLTRNRDKQHVAVTVWLLGALLLPLPVILRTIGFFPPNESEWVLRILMIHGFIDVTIMIMAGILIGSMIADIVEDSQKDTGRRSEGLFYAGQSFAGKILNGFGMVITGAILSIINFPKDVVPGEVPQSVLSNLVFIYVPLVIVFYSGAVYMLSRYKITRAGHANNLQAVDAMTKTSPDEPPAE